MKQTHFVDITMELEQAFRRFTPESIAHFSPKLIGHVGTHMDIMDTEGLSIERFISKMHLIDVTGIFEREITLDDAKMALRTISPGDSVLFKTLWSTQQFDTPDYFKNHPHLHDALVDYLLQKEVNLIGIDAPGIKRGKAHHAIDEHCANHGVFVVENLVNLSLIDEQKELDLYCFPLKWTKNTGVTCRVIVGES